MMRRIVLICTVMMIAAGVHAQEAQGKPKYKLDFVLKQLDHGKVMSTHNFTTSVELRGGAAQIRTGNRLPVDLGGEKGMQYIDVGFNCDANVDFVGTTNSVGLSVTWDLSTMPPGTGSEKLIRQVRVRSSANVPYGKPTLVGSAEDINTDQRFELDVTVTPEQ